MASITKKTNKKGQVFYEIRVHVDRNRPTLTERWYPQKGWSQTYIDKKLKTEAEDFERRCKAGEVLSRVEQKAREAEEKAREEEAARLAAEEAKKIKTLRQYGEKVFMPAKTITCAEKTRQYYQGALDRYVYPEFGNAPMPEITSAQLSAFFLSKQASGLSHSTLLGVYTTLNQLFQMAYVDDTIPRNPLDKVKRPRQKKDDKERTDPPRFSQEEVIKIKKLLANEPLKWQAFIWLLLDTGMRRGEACALTWEKVDLAKKTITIDGSLGYTPERGVYREKPKTVAGNRTIPMTAELSEVLKRYKAEQADAVARRTARLEKDHQPLDFKKITIPKYLFTVKGGSDPIFPDAVNRYFKRFSETYGIDDFHPHKLRHTAISIMLEKGVPTVIVAAIAGHDDPNVTNNTYAHASVEGMKAAMESLANATKIG